MDSNSIMTLKLVKIGKLRPFVSVYISPLPPSPLPSSLLLPLHPSHFPFLLHTSPLSLINNFLTPAKERSYPAKNFPRPQSETSKNDKPHRLLKPTKSQGTTKKTPPWQCKHHTMITPDQPWTLPNHMAKPVHSQATYIACQCSRQ